MFFVNIGFCSVALVLLTLVAVEAESMAARGPMLADAEIAAKQPAAHTAHLHAGQIPGAGGLRGTP